MSVLNVEHVSKSYVTSGEKVEVLSDVSMSVKRGEMVAIMGASGSGKTTLLQILSGIDMPDSGSVSMNGEVISSLSADEMAVVRRRKMGLIFQDFKLLDSINVQENIMLPLVIDDVDYDKQKQKVSDILSKLEIEHLWDKRINDISGGQKQKAAIARALVNEPNIVFADEPTGSLDRKSTKLVMECMQRLNREMGVAFVIVTHDDYTAGFCDRVLLLCDGVLSLQAKGRGDN